MHRLEEAYKIIACIERATTLWANIMRVARKYYKAGSYSRFDKLTFGSSLEGKALFKKPQNSEL